MKNNFRKKYLSCVSLLVLAWALNACSVKKQVLLPSGLKLGKDYLSDKKMAELGQNSLGVSQISYPFYPSAFVSEQKAANGLSKEEDAKRGIPFLPANVPSWDRGLYLDPPTVSHDCFSLQRLFVIPWGSNAAAVGKVSLSDTNALKKISAWRRVPYIQTLSDYGSDIEVMDFSNSNERILLFHWDGTFVSEKQGVEFPDTSRACQNGLSADFSGDVTVYDSTNTTLLCHIQLPDLGYFKVDQIEAGLGNPFLNFCGPKVTASMLVGCTGFLFPFPTSSGVEIYYYELKK